MALELGEDLVRELWIHTEDALVAVRVIRLAHAPTLSETERRQRPPEALTLHPKGLAHFVKRNCRGPTGA
jgi:hypothetical protein